MFLKVEETFYSYSLRKEIPKIKWAVVQPEKESWFVLWFYTCTHTNTHTHTHIAYTAINAERHVINTGV